MLKDLTSWIAEKLGFSEVAKVLDSFSFVDLFDKATKWLYDTETNIWFGGALDDLPEKMKALYTDLKTKLESFVKDYIYDGSGDKIKLFGQELPNMTDIIQFGTEMKIKLTEFVKNNIYDGSGDKIKLFGQELPNMTDIANFGTEMKIKLTEFVKNNIYDGSGDKIKLFGQELPNMTDIANFGTEIKTKLESFIKDYIYDGSGDKIKLFGQELPTEIIQFGTEIKTKLTEFVKNNIYDGTGDKIKLFGQELPTEIIQFGTEMKTKLESFIKDYIYDGSGDKIKLFGQELPNMTDIINFGTEIETKLESFIKDYIYNEETGEIFGLNFGDLFDVFPSIDDIKKKLTGLIPDMFVSGGDGDDSVDLSASTLDPGADKVDLNKLKTELDAGNEKAVMKYLSDTKSGDGIENEEEVLKILKTYGFYDGIIDDSAEGGITPKQQDRVQPAWARPRPSRAREGKRDALKAADTNGDGKVSKDENVDARNAKENHRVAEEARRTWVLKPPTAPAWTAPASAILLQRFLMVPTRWTLMSLHCFVPANAIAVANSRRWTLMRAISGRWTLMRLNCFGSPVNQLLVPQ
jgi:hypothetical protein